MDVYCERHQRRACCLNYSTLETLEDLSMHPLLLFSTVLELHVDQSRGGTQNHQWRQNKDAVTIAGIYVHVVNGFALVQEGFLGWYTIHEATLRRWENGLAGVAADLVREKQPARLV